MADDAQQPSEPEVVEVTPETDGMHLAKPEENLPRQVIALPLTQRPVFPSMMLPLVVPSGRLSEAMKVAVEQHGGHVAFFLTHGEMDDPGDWKTEDLVQIGTIAKILKFQETDNGSAQVFCQVLSRFVREQVITTEPYPLVFGSSVKPAVNREDEHVRALVMAIVTALKDLVQHNPVFADEIKMVLANYNSIEGPGRLADLAASLTTAKREDLQKVLEDFDVPNRMEFVLSLLAKESQLAEIKTRIQSQIEEKISDQQRKFFLNEQLKAIKEELGIETDGKSLEVSKFREAYEARKEAMSDEVKEVIEEELRKLELLQPESSEYGVSRNRLEWLTGMPWGDFTTDELDTVALRQGLDKDHYGLEDVKDRVVEFVGVRRLKQDRGGGIICLVGPPGTGKTSIGISIAKQLGREFYRFSVGGMRDEAEIKGHRRTYVGALPGKLAQALKRSGSMNPVILLDEIDKLSRGIQGDPASALLEVLDPEQNKDFLDHYLDVRLDLSQVLFVCTANDLGGIPEPLRDRMEIIRLAGYVEQEKLHIVQKYLLPKQRKEHGLTTKDVALPKASMAKIVRNYAREAGVRRAEQLVAKVMRKVATQKAECESKGEESTFSKVNVTPDTLEDLLGKPYMSDEELLPKPTPGVVTGLAWTSMGGATLEIEAVAIPAQGKGGYQLSGQLGDVMKESAGLARNYLRSREKDFGIPEGFFENHLIHLHVPAGATPKDGPSAGVTIATALLSLALGKAPKRKLGMTGELTLTGRVFPIGGVREKLVAAKRSKLKTALFPKANERDYDELPDTVKAGIDVHFVEQLDDVLVHAGLV